MKIFSTITVLTLLFSYGVSFAQVGVNTTNPTSTLDINGSLRVRKMSKDQEIKATKVVGMDDNGNFVDIKLDDNIYIDDNKLKVSNETEDIGSVDVITTETMHNAKLIIWPGGTNRRSSVVKLPTTVGNITLTGIDVSGAGSPAAAHGKSLWIMAVSGRIALKNENAGSDQPNQFILSSGTVNVNQYEMVQLMYDASIGAGIPGRWIIMSNKS